MSVCRIDYWHLSCLGIGLHHTHENQFPLSPFLYLLVFFGICTCIFLTNDVLLILSSLHRKLDKLRKSMKHGVSWRCPSVFHFKLSHLIPPSSLDAPPFPSSPSVPLSSLHPLTISCGGEWKRGKRDFGSICCYLQPVLTNNLLQVKRCSSISFSIRPQIVAPLMVNTQKETLQQSKQSKRLLNFSSIRRADRWH